MNVVLLYCTHKTKLAHYVSPLVTEEGTSRTHDSHKSRKLVLHTITQMSTHIYIYNIYVWLAK